MELVKSRAVSDDWIEPCTAPGCPGQVVKVKVCGITVPRKGCPVCLARNQRETEAQQLHAERAELERRMQAAHVPTVYHGASLARESGRVVRVEAWPGPRVLGQGVYCVTSDAELVTITTLRDWQTPGSAVVLSGPMGRGKSLLAAGIAQDEIRRRVRVRWVSWQALAGGLAARFDSETYERATQLLEAAAEMPLVVLDDLGLTTDKRALEAMERIICRRYDGGGRTIVTTNMTRLEARNRLDEAVISRLEEMVTRGGAWIDHQGPGHNVRM